ncbi:MAG: hypothetical protein ACXVAN_02260 [Polyangia bacterium]
MRVWVLLVAVSAIAGCGNHNNNGNNDGGGGSATLKSNIGLDLAHVVGFAISGGGPAASRAWANVDGGPGPTTSTLYAVDDHGNLVVTSVVTDTVGDGGTSSTSTSVKPTGIFDTARYVYFTFENLQVATGGSCQVILRKSDGALFCLPLPDNGTRVQSDGADRLFVDPHSSASGGSLGGLVRVDMSGATPQAVSINDSFTSDFTVNSDADAMVSLGDNTTRTVRVLKLNGGLQNLLADGSLLEWLGPNGHDFNFVSYGTTPGFDVHQSIRQADGSFVDSTVGHLSTSFNYVWQLSLVTTSVAYGWSKQPTGSSGIVELSGAALGTVHPVTGLTSIVDTRGAGNSIFVQGTDAAGNGGIVRLDVPAFTQTAILPPGDFSLTAISLSKSGELTFAGLRNSDGTHVVGSVAAGAGTYTISDAAAPIVTTLQRIN